MENYIEYYNTRKSAPSFLIDAGQDWGDSRIHKCEIEYKDEMHIQKSITAWGGSIKSAYDKAIEVYEETKSDRHSPRYVTVYTG